MYEPDYLKRGFVKLEADPAEQTPAAPSDWQDKPWTPAALGDKLRYWERAGVVLVNRDGIEVTGTLRRHEHICLAGETQEDRDRVDASLAASRPLQPVEDRSGNGRHLVPSGPRDVPEKNWRDEPAEEFGECKCPDCQAIRDVAEARVRKAQARADYLLKQPVQVSDELRDYMQRVMIPTSLPQHRPLQAHRDDELLAELRRRGLSREIGAERQVSHTWIVLGGDTVMDQVKGEVARIIGMELLRNEQIEFTTIRTPNDDRVTVRASFRFVRMTKRPPRGQVER